MCELIFINMSSDKEQQENVENLEPSRQPRQPRDMQVKFNDEFE